MKKRIVTALVCLALLLAALPMTVLAADTVPSGYTAIRTEADLKKIADNMAGKYILMNDITMAATWAPLGYTSSTNYTAFTGILDGNGHTISGYRAAGNSFVYYNKGTIKNLTISGSSNHGNTQGIFAVYNEGLVQNCHNQVSINSTVYTNVMTYTGGIVLSNKASGIVEYCSNQAALSVTVYPYSSLSDKGIRVGGIAGTNYGTIRKCWNTGNVTITGKSGTSGFAAGIVGYGQTGSSIDNCYNAGTIYADQDFYSDFSYNYSAAGIMAEVYDKNVAVTITDCYNAGSCSVYAPYSAKYVGAITGYAPGTQYTTCYFLEGTAANATYNTTSKNVTKLTSSQMSTQSSFPGLDFNNVWQMGTGSYRYPVIRTGCTHSVDKVAAREATCTEDGNIQYWYCSICNKYFNNSSKSKELSRSDVIIPAGHNYESVVTPNSCTEDGYTTYTCSKCGDSYTGNETEKTGHDYASVVTPPTCTEDGYTTHTCGNCGDTYTDAATERTGHDYESAVTPPTCTEDGYTTYTCGNCGDTYTDDETEATGHDHEAVVTPPTCTEDGYTTYTCGNCGDTYTDDETEATGHDHEAVVTPPTCTEDGYTTYTCGKCGDSYTDDETEKTGHDHEPVVTPPTCTEDGYTTYTCGKCGDSYTDSGEAKTGHSYDSVVTAPTCTKDGYTTYTCSVCGDTYIDDETDPIDHADEDEDGLCDGCGKDIRNDITITQPEGGKVTVSDTTPETGDKVTITATPNTGKEVDKVTVTDKTGNKITTKDNGDGTYTFTQPEGDLTVTVTFKDKKPVETTPPPPTDGSPETGDRSLAPLVLLMAVSLAGTASLLIWKKREYK